MLLLATRRVVAVKGTGAVPARIVGSEGAVEEVGKGPAVVLGGDLVVARLGVVLAADAEEDLDAAGLAVADVLLHVHAVAEEVGGHALGVVVGPRPAVAGEVGARVARGAVLGRLVDEGEGHVLDAGVAVVCEAFAAVLALSLTSVTEVSFLSLSLLFVYEVKGMKSYPVAVQGSKGAGGANRKCHFMLLVL